MSGKISTYERQAQDGILLNANECSTSLPKEIIEEIRQAVSTIAFNRYPDNDQKELLSSYADVIHVKEENLLAGNGSDQMLGLMIGTFGGKGRTIYTVSPDFSMYDYYASAYESDLLKFPLNEDGSFDPDAFIKKGKESKVSLVLFSNPNNPTGHCLAPSAIQKIAGGFRDIPVLIDEAYIEFADTDSALSLLDSCTNLYITRTLSKAYGLAGIRTGFLISNKENMAKMKRLAVPYALNTLSMTAASIVLHHPENAKNYIYEIKHSRQKMYQKLNTFKHLQFEPSQANFFYGRCQDVPALKKLFDEAGIRIRTYGDNPHFRITIGTEEENKKVLAVLEKYEELYK